MVATEPGKPEKISIFKKVCENLEKLGKILKKNISQGIILG